MRALRGGDPAASGGDPALNTVARRSVRLSPLGYAGIRLGCRSDAFGACGGVLTLRSVTAIGCGANRMAAGTLVGSASFRIAAVPALVPVRIRATARRLVRCGRRIRVRAAAAPSATAEFDIRAR